MTSEYQKRLKRIRTRYPKAYERWSTHDENLLGHAFEAGANIAELSTLLQRQPSAIKSRLRRLGLSTKSESRKETKTNIGFSFEWKAMLRDTGEAYVFPKPITTFMKRRYNCPAIYRWVAHRTGQTYPQLMYIGASKRLCPDRLEGYLNPRTSKTNKRLNEQFTKCLQQGFEIHLQILHVSDIVIGGLLLSPPDLSINNTRLFVEKLLVIYYRQKGYTLLNLD
jgi:hypothetical protein